MTPGGVAEALNKIHANPIALVLGLEATPSCGTAVSAVMTVVTPVPKFGYYFREL